MQTLRRRAARDLTGGSPSRCGRGSRRRRRTSSRAGATAGRRRRARRPGCAADGSDGAATSSTSAPGRSRAVDVHGHRRRITAVLIKTVHPGPRREANVSIRLAPGQDPDEIAATLTRLLERRRRAVPSVEVALQNAAAAGARARRTRRRSSSGSTPSSTSSADDRCSIRTGWLDPALPALAARGIPTILTGFPTHRLEHPLAERAPRRVLSRRRGRGGRASCSAAWATYGS